AGPVQRGGFVLVQIVRAAIFTQQLDGIDRQNALVPQAALEGAVSAPLFGQIGGGLNREVADLLHGAVGKLGGFVGFVGQTQLVQRVLEAHQAHADRAVAQVGVTRGLDTVVVVLDDVIEHAHGGVDGLFQLFDIQLTIFNVLRQVHRTQI